MRLQRYQAIGKRDIISFFRYGYISNLGDLALVFIIFVGDALDEMSDYSFVMELFIQVTHVDEILITCSVIKASFLVR